MGERISGLRARIRAGERLVSTFVKTPDVQIVEVLAHADLDFLILDAEHAPFGRDRLDACLAVGRALDLPLLVRVPDGAPGTLLTVLDAGAAGLVVPHVDSPAKAASIARAAHFGEGGRGFAGSTRWAGYATRGMPDVLAQDAETIVMAQIEEPSGVEAAPEIAATADIDALFIGPADLTVCYGHSSLDNPDLERAFARVAEACRAAGIGMATWVPNAEVAAAWAPRGVTTFVTGSEHSWMLAGARAAASGIKAI